MALSSEGLSTSFMASDFLPALRAVSVRTTAYFLFLDSRFGITDDYIV